LEAELTAVLGETDARAMGAIRRRIAANALRDLALGALVNRRGLRAVGERMVVVGAERLLELRASGTPVVAVMAHVGAQRSVTAALEKLRIPAQVASLQRTPRVIDAVRYAPLDDSASGTRFLRRALADLQRGIVPVLAIDGAVGSTRAVTLLGREARVARGLAVLAGAGARLVPLTGRWVGLSGRIETTVHEPLPTPPPGARDEAWEEAVLGCAVRWLEAYIRGHPSEMRLDKVRTLARAPRAPGPPAAGGPREPGA